MDQKEAKRLGRPPIHDDEMLQINIRLTQEQIDWLSDEAKERGRIGRNAVVRSLIDAARRRREPKNI
jgi:hypothetical protein